MSYDVVGFGMFDEREIGKTVEIDAMVHCVF